jgi:hypothetical protein
LYRKAHDCATAIIYSRKMLMKLVVLVKTWTLRDLNFGSRWQPG